MHKNLRKPFKHSRDSRIENRRGENNLCVLQENENTLLKIMQTHITFERSEIQMIKGHKLKDSKRSGR